MTDRAETDWSILDTLPDGVVVADEHAHVTTVNRAAGHLLGADPRESVGRAVRDVVCLQDQQSNDWFGCNAPYDGLRSRTALTEQSWFTATGTELLVTARLVRAAPGGPISSLVISLRSARGRARLDRERSDLVATVAHELRSPLTGVKGFATTLLARWDRLRDDQKKLMLETVVADADRLTRLIAELLDVARIDTGRLSLFARPVDLVAAVERVLASVRSGTGREVCFSAEPGLPLVMADPDKLAQVLTNLVENAVLHGEGTVRVTASFDARTASEEVPVQVERRRRRREPLDGPPTVTLRVDDEGEGIKPEIRSRVFTKFWTSGTRGGSGLGMYIVCGLVTAHGGSITIEDAPTGGARIVVRWPVATDSS